MFSLEDRMFPSAFLAQEVLLVCVFREDFFIQNSRFAILTILIIVPALHFFRLFLVKKISPPLKYRIFLEHCHHNQIFIISRSDLKVIFTLLYKTSTKKNYSLSIAALKIMKAESEDHAIIVSTNKL